MSSIREAKQALRKRMREGVLTQMSRDQIERQSRAVVQRVLAHPSYLSARSLGIYLSTTSGEIETDAIIRHAFQGGKAVFLPSWTSQFSAPDQKPRLLAEMRMVKCATPTRFEQLPTNKWGIREPILTDQDIFAFDRDLDASSLDLVIMPGVCFTAGGKRLGYGKGYYDRFLQKAHEWSTQHSKQRPMTLALAFTEQVLAEDEIPMDSDGHDMLMDHILTADGALK